MADVLTQTRLPSDLAEWLKGEADKEGEAISSYLRRMIFRAAGRAHADAWIRAAGINVRDMHEAGGPPDLDLEIVERVSAMELICTAHSPDGVPLTELAFRTSGLFRTDGTRCVVLRGSPYTWQLTASLWETKTRRIELTIHQQQRLDT